MFKEVKFDRKIYLFIYLFIFSLVVGTVNVFALDTGFTSSGTLANDAGVGTTAWTETSNASSSDNDYAANDPDALPDFSNYLKTTNFGFNLPGGSTINGIEAKIERKAGGPNLIRDNRVRVVKSDGSVGTTDKSNSTAWPTSDGFSNYGNDTDLWGETWSASDINDADFGIVLAIHEIGAGPQAITGYVDHVQMKVYYTVTDSTPPNVTINFPANTTYGNGNTTINFNVSLSEAGSVNYTLDGGVTNITMLNATGQGLTGLYFNRTNSSLAQGSFTFQVYAEDTSGNKNYTESVVFSVDEGHVNACGTLSIAGKSYTLQNSLTTTSTCFTIGNDNITLDGKGYSIDGDDGSGDYGISMVNRFNITIKNFANVSDFFRGINVDNTDNSTIFNNTLYSNGQHGIFLRSTGGGSDGNHVFNNSVFVSASGVWVTDAGSRNIIEGNNFIGNSRGVAFDSTARNNIVLNNNFSASTTASISDDTGTSYTNYFIYNNSFGEIKWTNESFLKDLELSTDDLSFPGDIVIGNNSVFVNSSDFSSSVRINSSANVTLYGIGDRGFNNVSIFKDGAFCADCYNFTSLTADTVIFNVTSWSNYSIAEGSPAPSPSSGSSGGSSGGGGSSSKSTGSSGSTSVTTPSVRVDYEGVEEVPISCSVSCNSWSVCGNVDEKGVGVRERNCVVTGGSECSEGSFIDKSECRLEVCIPDWDCSDWTKPIAGSVYRKCIDVNECGLKNSGSTGEELVNGLLRNAKVQESVESSVEEDIRGEGSGVLKTLFGKITGFFVSLGEKIGNVDRGITGNAVLDGEIPVTECTVLDQEGKTYRLQNDVLHTGFGTCLDIIADGIILEGEGMKVIGDGNRNNGIKINLGLNDVQVKNVNIDNFGDFAIQVEGRNSFVENINVVNSRVGLRLSSMAEATEGSIYRNINVDDCFSKDGLSHQGVVGKLPNSEIDGLTINNCMRGIWIASSSGGIIKNAEIRDVSQFAVKINDLRDYKFSNLEISEFGNGLDISMNPGGNIIFENFKILTPSRSRNVRIASSTINNGPISFINFENSGEVDLFDKIKLYYENSQYGKIYYLEGVEVTGIDLPNVFKFSSQSFVLDTSLVVRNRQPNLRFGTSPAIVTLYDIGGELAEIAILKDGEICENCEILSLENGELSFKIDGIGEYTLTGAVPIVPEICDDGIDNDFDGFVDGEDSDCINDFQDENLCGNGIIEDGEECDDGSIVSGDGCNSVCFVEDGFSCIGEPSVCEIDGIPECPVEDEIAGICYVEGRPLEEKCEVKAGTNGFEFEFVEISEEESVCSDALLLGLDDVIGRVKLTGYNVEIDGCVPDEEVYEQCDESGDDGGVITGDVINVCLENEVCNIELGENVNNCAVDCSASDMDDIIIVDPEDADPECQTGDTLTTSCPNNVEIISSECVDEIYVETGNECPALCLQDVTQTCSDGSEVVLWDCDSEEGLIDTGLRCPVQRVECQRDAQITCTNGGVVVTERCTASGLIETGNTCPVEIVECQDGDVQTKTCADGSEIIEKICNDGTWNDNSNVCPSVDECAQDEIINCEDGNSIVTRECIDGVLGEETGAECSIRQACTTEDKVTKTCTNGEKIILQECVGNQLVETGNECEIIIECSESVKQTCSNGDEIVLQECIDGVLGEELDVECVNYCEEGDTITETCSDGTSVIVENCINGELQKTGNECKESVVEEIVTPGSTGTGSGGSGGGGSGGSGGSAGISSSVVLDINKWKETGELDVSFMEGKNEFPQYCYNSIKDEDETGTDCGGSCKTCKIDKSTTGRVVLGDLIVTSGLLGWVFAIFTVGLLMYMVYSLVEGFASWKKSGYKSSGGFFRGGSGGSSVHHGPSHGSGGSGWFSGFKFGKGNSKKQVISGLTNQLR